MLSCPRCGSTYVRDVVHCGLDGERLVRSETDLLLGRTVDRYAIEGVLGDGGMARVYRARHVHLAQPFALKVLFGDMAMDRALAERFRREGQSAAQIKHPNVVSVTDFGVSAEGLSFMAMELLDGPTLAEVAKRERSLSPARVGAIVRQVAEGLGAAHALGFVHRDLKPKNVMVVHDGERQRVKILDFGLVRPLDGVDARLTQQGQIFGTPAYMAPEQITEGEIDPRTDLYALGAMLYELMSGQPPFVGGMADIFKKHLYEAPVPLPDRSGLGELALVLLSKEKNARPRNTREVIEIIDGLGLGLETDGVLVSMPPALTPSRGSAPAHGAAGPAPVGAPAATPPGARAAGYPPAAGYTPAEATPSAGARPASGRPRELDLTGASPRASAEMSIDPTDSMGIAIVDSRELDERAIERMVAGSRPSLMWPAVFVVALGVGGWLGYRWWAATPTAPPVAPALDSGVVVVVGGAPDAGSDGGLDASASDAGTPRKRPSGAASAAASAAAAAAGGLAGGLSGAIAGAVAGAVTVTDEDPLPPIPSRDAGAVEPSAAPTVDVTDAGPSSPAPSSPAPSSPAPTSPAPSSPAPTTAPPVDAPAGSFTALDLELRRALLGRDLHLMDLEPHAPEALRQWRAWRMLPEGKEPARAERDAAYADLREGVVLASLDPRTLLELKLARLNTRIEDTSGVTPELRTELETLVGTAAAAKTAAARAAVLTQLLHFELKLDRLRGVE
jgi:serine/threonine-protein kinase